MRNPERKIAFVLASSDHGSMIVNRFDYNMVDAMIGFGVGYQILNTTSFDAHEVDWVLNLLELRRQYFGVGVVAIDCGANIGVHTVEWAKRMTGWGSVIAFEPQERVYYALAGNVALNNCFNARAIHAAVSDKNGTMNIPVLDHQNPASFGSLEIKKRERSEAIGQRVDYSERRTVEVKCVTLDSLGLDRIDIVKIDVEGMELDVLAGGQESIARSRPIMLIESTKTDQSKLRAALAGHGYAVLDVGQSFLAIHTSDPTLNNVKRTGP
jgi:FkbM family methyltransferase